MSFGKTLLFLVFAWCGNLASDAQIAATLELPRKMYLAGERVIGVVRITNHAGRALVFQSDGRAQWLNFMLKDSAGNTINPKPTKLFGPMKVEAGKTMARTVELAKLFQLSEPGNFSVTASIRDPREKTVMGHTNKVFFIQSNGRTEWRQSIGLGRGNVALREYRLVRFSDQQKSYLYAQVRDGTGTRKLSTFRLGEALSMRRPMATVDRNQRMHVMYLGSPTMWVHCVVNSNGGLESSGIHKRAPVGDPRLLTSGDGVVQVVNSIPYNPNAARKQEGKIRKATDRPNITY